MFKHVGLDPKEIAELGDGQARRIREQGSEPTPKQIAVDQQRMEERAIKLNSASIDISSKFSKWWPQASPQDSLSRRRRLLPNLDC